MNPAVGNAYPKNKWSSFLFAGLVFLLCAWVLLMPVFPSQDGPMHKYYVHALSEMGHGSVIYRESYRIRHPLPPYATHYALLLGMATIVSLDHAESLLVCLIIVMSAYSFRFCANSLGPNGDRVSFFVLPLLLSWPLFMGFFNYTLGIGLFFLAAGLWCRFHSSDWKLPLLFVGSVIALTFTHPVPLLLLILLLFFDLSTTLIQAVRQRRAPLLLPEDRWRIITIALACLCFLYPVLISDKSQVGLNLTDFKFHAQVAIASLGLYGLSPFNPRSHDLLINLYRVGLIFLLVFSLLLAGSGIVRRVRSAQLRQSDVFFLISLTLGIAIPFLPVTMNNAAFFSQRMVIFVWLTGLLAAAGYESDKRNFSKIVPWVATALVAITLTNVQRFISPISRDLANIEAQPLPVSAEGLVFSGKHLFDEEKWKHQIAFSPYGWSGALPLIHADSVMLNSPFLDMTTMPIKGAPGSNQIISHLDDTTSYKLNGNNTIENLDPALQASTIRATDFVIVVGPIHDLQYGLDSYVDHDTATMYSCVIHDLNFVCIKNGRGTR